MGYISGGFPIKHTSGMNGVATLDLTMAPIESSALRLAFSMACALILALSFF